MNADSYDQFIRAEAARLRAKDVPPASVGAWEKRKAQLRGQLLTALGPVPEAPCDLEPRVVGVLKRDGYRIEKLTLQTRPDVWASCSLYVPEGSGKRPAVLGVHGHWAGARRDPVVQARCLGLVKLGFVVLAIDAFSAGERHPEGKGYHGALLGATLWPTGHSLLGLQVYDNRRAVDYLASRPEVDAARLGVTGASGGGNQTMYAGALDDRLKCVVPVCSVGTYQAYLHAACCVCEVLPGALRFTEEGDVLGLVAPRALMVVSATRDAFQFSVGEAKKSLARAEAVYKLLGAPEKLTHAVFESPHDYSRAMREAMYGWMTRWLKGEGDGKPIPDPTYTVDPADDLACFPGGKRPATFLFPPTFAAREAKRLLAPLDDPKLDHAEAWEAQAAQRLLILDEVFGGRPKVGKVTAKVGPVTTVDRVRATALTLEPEPGLTLRVEVRSPGDRFGKAPTCVLLELGGAEAALAHPAVPALLTAGWVVYAPELRATGAARPKGDAIAGAQDHNSAEHGLWVGRPLLGQWVTDVEAVLAFVAAQPGLDARRTAVVGVGPAALVALCAGALLPDRVAATAALGAPATLVTTTAYPPTMPMGLLAPGLLRAGDVPHLAALCAPRRLLLEGAPAAFAFPRKIYGLTKADKALVVREKLAPGDLPGLLAPA